MHKKTIWDMHRLTVEEFRAADKAPVCLVVDNVRSLNNIGSLFRTCDAFAAACVHLCGISAAPPSPEIHKTALGAEDSVAWLHHDDTLACVRALQKEGWTAVCLEQVEGSVMLPDFSPDPAKRYALVIGNEVEGVDAAVVDACDMWLEIPQKGTKHSLNVAVSAGIALWALVNAGK